MIGLYVQRLEDGDTIIAALDEHEADQPTAHVSSEVRQVRWVTVRKPGRLMLLRIEQCRRLIWCIQALSDLLGVGLNNQLRPLIAEQPPYRRRHDSITLPNP